MSGAAANSASQYCRADSAAFGPLSTAKLELSNVVIASRRAPRAQSPHITQRRFDSIAPAQAAWASQAQMLAEGVRDAGAYRGRLTAAAVLLAIIAVLLAIPVTPFL